MGTGERAVVVPPPAPELSTAVLEAAKLELATIPGLAKRRELDSILTQAGLEDTQSYLPELSRLGPNGEGALSLDADGDEFVSVDSCVLSLTSPASYFFLLFQKQLRLRFRVDPADPTRLVPDTSPVGEEGELLASPLHARAEWKDRPKRASRGARRQRPATFQPRTPGAQTVWILAEIQAHGSSQFGAEAARAVSQRDLKTFFATSAKKLVALRRRAEQRRRHRGDPPGSPEAAQRQPGTGEAGESDDMEVEQPPPLTSPDTQNGEQQQEQAAEQEATAAQEAAQTPGADPGSGGDGTRAAAQRSHSSGSLSPRTLQLMDRQQQSDPAAQHRQARESALLAQLARATPTGKIRIQAELQQLWADSSPPPPLVEGRSPKLPRLGGGESGGTATLPPSAASEGGPGGGQPPGGQVAATASANN